jgi:hypothetical protein
MASTSQVLNAMAANVYCRLFMVAFGAAVLWFYRFTIFASLVNPLNLIQFVLVLYIVLAAAAAVALFFLKDTWLLIFALPAVALVSVHSGWKIANI